jgi:hypothetical protein
MSKFIIGTLAKPDYDLKRCQSVKDIDFNIVKAKKEYM